jgi:hypothetical protein
MYAKTGSRMPKTEGMTGVSEREAFANYVTTASERSERAGVTGFEPEKDGRLATLGAASFRIRIPFRFAPHSLRSFVAARAWRDSNPRSRG